jgi:hypothetical protein
MFQAGAQRDNHTEPGRDEDKLFHNCAFHCVSIKQCEMRGEKGSPLMQKATGKKKAGHR